MNRLNKGRPNSHEFVYLLDDEPITRTIIKETLISEGYQVIVYDEASKLLARRPPKTVSCLLLDVEMPDMNGVEIQKHIQQQGWLLPIIFVSAHGTVPIAAETMKKGAVDFLTKPLTKNALCNAVERALQLSRELHSERHDRERRETFIQQLTDREREVLRWIIAGHLNKQIASGLGISERTVKAHRARMMEKLGVDSLAELVSLALKCQIEPLATAQPA